MNFDTIPAESQIVIMTAGIGFLGAYLIVAAYVIEKPARALARFVVSFFL